MSKPSLPIETPFATARDGSVYPRETPALAYPMCSGFETRSLCRCWPIPRVATRSRSDIVWVELRGPSQATFTLHNSRVTTTWACVAAEKVVIDPENWSEATTDRGSADSFKHRGVLQQVSLPVHKLLLAIDFFAFSNLAFHIRSPSWYTVLHRSRSLLVFTYPV